MPVNLTQYVTALSGTTAAAGASFSFSTTAVNNGNTSAAASTSRVFLSASPFFTGQETVLAIQSVSSLGAGMGTTQNYTVTLPAGLPPGVWYLGGLADYFGQVGESNEGDNNANYVRITVTPPPAPNLTQYVTALSSTTVTAGASFSFSTTAVNNGAASAGASTSRVFLSTGPSFTGQETVLAVQSVASLGAGVGTTQNYSITLPASLAPGTWYVGGLADYSGQVGESNEGDNNANYVAITVAPPPAPNLTQYVTALSSTSVAAGGSFSFSTTAVNYGSSSAAASTSRVFLSTSPRFTGQETVLAVQAVPSLGAGVGATQNYSVSLPGNLAAGTWYIGGLADYFGQVGESNEGDNSANYVAITVGSPFAINFNYSGDPQYQQYFTNAANRWSQVITNDLPDVQSGTWGYIDDLLIQVNVSTIDGVGGILGQAGWDARRGGANGLPYHGTMTFDSADVANLVANGTFGSVVLHEIGHILGIGTLWDTFGLRSGSNYIGANAVNAYRSLTGNSALTSVPLETGGGSGTALSHWSEASFNSELMTGFAESSEPMPLSILTVGGLADLGYAVSYGAADSYSLLMAESNSSSSVFVNGTISSSLEATCLALAESIASSFAVASAVQGDPGLFGKGFFDTPVLVPPDATAHV